MRDVDFFPGRLVNGSLFARLVVAPGKCCSGAFLDFSGESAGHGVGIAAG